MTGPVTIGLFDTAHNIGQYSTVAFDHVQVAVVDDPAARAAADRLDRPGHRRARDRRDRAATTNPTFTVIGAGADIFGTSDQFNFASVSTSSDGSLSARVVTQTNTSSSAKAGVMFRATTDPGSPTTRPS